MILALLAFSQVGSAGAVENPTHLAGPETAPSPFIPSGFAPPGRTNLAPILDLASPGAHRAERAMAALDRQLGFQRQALHPAYSPSLEHLFEKIPPRNSTLIRAASVYSRADIPWTEVDGTREICAQGYPSGENFYVTTSPSCEPPQQPFRLGAYFELKPPRRMDRSSASMESVIGTFGGEMKTDTFGFGAIIDAVARMLTEVYGDLAPPWDTEPGTYNHHDAASRERFRRDMPTLDDKFHQYFKYDNILDEFEGPGGPYVLFNFIGEIQPDALKKFPDLNKFYRAVAPSLTTEVDVMDEKSDYWMRSGFDRGKLWLSFMVRGGKLSAFDGAYHPVGEPVELSSIRRGFNRSRTTIRLQRLGMTFGLENLNFVNYFNRDASTISFEARMDAVPVLVAPPGIQQGAEFIAGEFLRTLAQGSGGMHSEIASKALGDGTVRFSSEVSGEFRYSPAMEFFANLADSIADKDDPRVRAQGRAMMLEFLDSFVKDYNNARPRILALDRDPALTQ